MHGIQLTNGSRAQLALYIAGRKKSSKFTVVDVGGSDVGWSKGLIDAMVDINCETNLNGNVKTFAVNINIDRDWKLVEDYVNKNDKFDFSICTHTLEDVHNPQLVCEKLSKISKMGYIAVPSKYVE